MNSILLAICLALHTLATVLLAGNYLLGALVILPVLGRHISEEEQSRLLDAIVTASRPWVLGSLAAFLVTGTLMLLTNSHYLGFMEIGNSWSVWIYTKHIVVLGVIGLGIYLDMGVARRLSDARDAGRPGLLARYRLVNGLTALGCVAVLLITAAAQVM
jgi:uncharacterized membrane protein